MKTYNALEQPRYLAARQRLSDFVIEQAHQTAAELGFGWTTAPDAPSDYTVLRDAFNRSVSSKQPLPVSSLYCETAIFSTVEANHALRFWHDVHHIRHGLSFHLDDEVELGLWQMRQAEKAGIRRGTLAWQMFRIECVGQNYVIGICGRFPLDQWRFVRRCLETGLDNGVLEEARLSAA